MTMKRVIFIRAKRDNARLDRKHLMDVGGKPLIAHVIEHAIQSNAHAMFLSTNCREILALGKEYPELNCIERPESLCNDDGDPQHTIWAIDDFHWTTWKNLAGSSDPIGYCTVYGNTLCFDKSAIDRAFDLFERHPTEVVHTGYIAGNHEHPYDAYIENDRGVYRRMMDRQPLMLCNDWPAVVMNNSICTIIKAPYNKGPRDTSRNSFRYCLTGRFDSVHIDDRHDHQLACGLWEVHRHQEVRA